MQYIAHRRYKKTGANGKEFNFPRGTVLYTVGKFIQENGSAICYTTSEDAFMYFARNDDGKGLERGDLTYKIAYSNRKPNEDNEFRFSDSEREMLELDYPQFLEDSEFIIFNYDFFNADTDILHEIAGKLGMDN